MVSFWEPVGPHKSHFALALAGVALSTGGALIWEPLLSLSQKGADKITTYLPVFAYLFLLNPLNFYLNILLLVLHVVAHAGTQAPLTVFLSRKLPRASHTVNLATLVLSAPLLVQVAVAEESIGFAIPGALVCLALVSMLSSIFKKLLVSRGFVPALFALCISIGFLTSVDPLLSFTDKNHYDPLVYHIPIHLLLSFVSFFVFILSITLVILRLGTPAAIQAENSVIAALSVAIASLLVGWYMRVYAEVTGMAQYVVEAGELQQS